MEPPRAVDFVVPTEDTSTEAWLAPNAGRPGTREYQAFTSDFDVGIIVKEVSQDLFTSITLFRSMTLSPAELTKLGRGATVGVGLATWQNALVQVHERQAGSAREELDISDRPNELRTVAVVPWRSIGALFSGVIFVVAALLLWLTTPTWNFVALLLTIAGIGLSGSAVGFLLRIASRSSGAAWATSARQKSPT